MQTYIYRYIVLCFSLLQLVVHAQIQPNQIYFTNNENIHPNEASIGDTQTSFDIDEDIYAFIITNGTIENILPHSQRYFYIKTKALPALSEERFKTPSDYINPMASYYLFPVLLHERPETNYNTSAYRVMQHLSELPHGVHQVAIQIKEEGNVKFSSSFDLQVHEKSNDISNAPEINPKQREKGYLEFGMKQSDIEKAILKLLEDAYPAYGFDRIIITSAHFKNKRKSSGKIDYRTLNADVISKRGGKCRAYDVTVMQKKVGTDFGVYELKNINGYYPVSCVDAR